MEHGRETRPLVAASRNGYPDPLGNAPASFREKPLVAMTYAIAQIFFVLIMFCIVVLINFLTI